LILYGLNHLFPSKSCFPEAHHFFLIFCGPLHMFLDPSLFPSNKFFFSAKLNLLQVKVSTFRCEKENFNLNIVLSYVDNFVQSSFDSQFSSLFHHFSLIKILILSNSLWDALIWLDGSEFIFCVLGLKCLALKSDENDLCSFPPRI